MSVSVVVPCRDAAPYLAQAVGSALDQGLPPHEVVVVDDGSTDGSLELALRLRAGAPDRVRVVSAPGRGAAASRNLGAAVATGEALLFLDADDVLGPGTVAALAAALAGQPDGFAVCRWYRLVPTDRGWERRRASCRPRRRGEHPLDAWLTGWYAPPAAVLWSRDGFERAGRWDDLARYDDDGDLVRRALVLGVPLVETPHGAALYRRQPAGRGSLSGSRLQRSGIADRLRVLDKLAVLLEEQGGLREHGGALAEAYRTLAREAAPEHAELAARAAAAGRTVPVLVRLRHDAAGLVRHVAWRARQRHGSLRGRAAGVADDRPAADPAAEPAIGAEGTPAAESGTARAAQVLAAGADREPGAPERDPRPAVSVVVPTYQRAHVVRRALESALAQTVTDLEVLVVDDGSTDDTAALVGALPDARVRYLAQPRNLGVSAARNRGLREARADVIALLDSDDEWLPDKLDRQLRLLATLPERVGLLYCGVQTVDGAGMVRHELPAARGGVRHLLLQRNVVHGTSGVLLRRPVVATVGFFDEGIPAAEDYDYWLRVSRWFEFDAVDEPLVRYHDPQGVQRKSLHLQDNAEAREWLFRKHHAAMRRAGVAHLFLLTSARRRLRYDRGGHEGRAHRRAIRWTALRAVLEAPADVVVLRALPRALLGPPARVRPAAPLRPLGSGR